MVYIKKIISFSGLDGSGKTTHALESIKFLKSKGIRVDYVELQKKSIMNIVGSKVYKVVKKRNKFYFFRKVTMVLDILTFYLKTLFKKNIVCDRYFYDILVHATYVGAVGRNFSKFYLKMIPKPTMAFLLRTTGKEAFSRKPEYDINFFSAKEKLYDNLKKHFTVIDSNGIGKTQKEINKKLSRIIWS